MTATRQEIEIWVRSAKRAGDRYVIVACDSYDFTDYPIFIKEVSELNSRLAEINRTTFGSVHEVYDLSMDIDEQLNSHRGWNDPKDRTSLKG